MNFSKEKKVTKLHIKKDTTEKTLIKRCVCIVSFFFFEPRVLTRHGKKLFKFRSAKKNSSIVVVECQNLKKKQLNIESILFRKIFKVLYIYEDEKNYYI
jgi:hypothetical protein